MSKTLMLALTLLLCTGWLLAQSQSQYPSSSSSSSSNQSATSSSSGENHVQGCLQGSSGNFTLTSDSGKTYKLEGDTSKLTEHVGHEVEITGTKSGSEGASSSGGSSASSGTSSSSSEPTLTVQNVKHISKTCKSASK